MTLSQCQRLAELYKGEFDETREVWAFDDIFPKDERSAWARTEPFVALRKDTEKGHIEAPFPSTDEMLAVLPRGASMFLTRRTDIEITATHAMEYYCVIASERNGGGDGDTPRAALCAAMIAAKEGA